MRSIRIFALWVGLSLTGLTAGERPLLLVHEVDGSLKVQRSGAESFLSVSPHERLASGDIMETGSQSRAVIACGNDNMLVLTANTKAMIVARARTRRSAEARALRVTLFSGGILLSVTRPCSAAVFTAHAVVETPTGALSVSADPLSGESGIYVLCAESVAVRSVTGSRIRYLRPGQQTVIGLRSDPGPGRPLTEAIAAALGDLFGDTLVKKIMTSCGTRPYQAEGGAAESIVGARLFSGHEPGSSAVRPLTYQPFFRPNTVWGAILDDRRRQYRFYSPAKPLRPLFDNHWSLAVWGGAALAGGKGYGRFSLSPSLHWRVVEAALEIELARTHERWTMPALLDGYEGIADLVDHVTIGLPEDSLFVTVGRIDGYSIAEGLVVQRFTNRNPYSLFQPLGLVAQAALGDIVCLDGFVNNIVEPTVGGLHAYLRTSGYYVGAGYYYDINQYHRLPAGVGNRFVAALPDTVPAGRREELHLCEINLGTDIVSEDAFELRLMGEIAYRFKNLTHTAGYVVRAPRVVAGWKGMEFSLGYNLESGALISGQFGWMYPTNRYRVTDTGTRLLTQNGMLSPERVARGFVAAYRYSPVSGLSLECEYRQDILTRSVYADTTFRSRDNYDIFFSAVLTERLVPFLHRVCLSIGCAHGGLYPPGATFSTAWGQHGSLAVITRPLVANIAFAGGVEYYTLDLDPTFNNRCESSERIWEFYLGARWGFR